MSKVFIFTDTHLGARSNSTEWMDIMEEAHFKFIIPTIKKHFKPGDIIINCGDVFDNRTSINVKSMDLGIKIYEELSKIGPVHIIAGNHDIYYKTSTEISSLDILKYIPNVTVQEGAEQQYIQEPMFSAGLQPLPTTFGLALPGRQFLAFFGFLLCKKYGFKWQFIYFLFRFFSKMFLVR